jgi:phosphoribosyl-dephospho-CoA transferase
LLIVDPEAYALALAARPELCGEPLVGAWAERGFPLIARHRGPCDRPGLIAAGLPLPPPHGKRRIALALAPAAIREVAPPPLLRAAASCAPAPWRAAIDAILDLGRRAGVEIRTFGGLAWSALTGLEYLSASSDLDLLLVVEGDADVPALLEGLARIAARAPMRLDGEIVRQDRTGGFAAHWREVAGGGEVLVKTIDGVALRPAQEFLSPPENEARSRRAAP